MSCTACDHNRVHGSWPPAMLNRGTTHCYDCHRSWSSKVEAHCPACHLHFSKNSTADLHDPHCHPDSEVTRKRLLSARRKGGTPVLALRERRDGPVFVRWSPEDGDSRW